MSGSDPTRLRQLLGPLGRKLGVEDGASSAKLWRSWGDVVGAEIAAHAEPTSLREGVLRVRTQSTVWATEIGYLAPEIARRANDLIGPGCIREVRVWTSAAPIATRDKQKGTSEERIDPTSRDVTKEPSVAFRRAWEAWARRRSKSPT